MKRNFFIVAIVLALAVVGIASGASSDQGRRLAGPFCVGKANLSPFYAKGIGWISRAGVVRSVSVTEQCQRTEIRKFGVAVPDVDVQPTAPVAGPQGPKGDKGDKGDTGATGATGPAGPAGKDGTNGGDDENDVQQGLAVCASNGGNLKLCGGDNGHDPVGYLILAGQSS